MRVMNRIVLDGGVERGVELSNSVSEWVKYTKIDE